MEGKYLDNCLSIEANDDAYKEKTRIAEVATATLCRLNGIMKQMKDRRDERAKLTSNMWRLKLALCVAGKETEDTLHADPLIERQRGEIKRLELANRTLKKEIADVKASLPEVGGTTLTEINVEIDELRNDHVRRYGKIGGNDGVECLNKIEELIRMVEKTRETMSGLNDNRGAEGNSNEWRDIERLEGLVGNVCDGMEQLEVIVTAGDRWNMSRSVEQLEGVIVRLKSESKEKDEHVNVLCQELFDMKSLVEQRNKELKGEQGKVASLLDEYKALKGRTKRMEEERRTEEIQREQEGSRKELEQLQQVKREASMVKKRLQNLEADKEGLLKEMGRIREVLQKRDEEAKVAEKEATEKTMDLMKNVSRENEKLRNKINELERAKRKERETVVGVEKKNVDAEKRSRETSRQTGVELERLRGNLAVSKEELDRANREIVDLKAKLEHFSSDKTRLETSIFHLESKKEILVYQLGAEKTTAEERVKELAKLESNYNELDVERTNLKNKKEQLSVELANLKIEKKSMEESVERVRVKCSTLEDEIDRYKSECDNLREEMRNLKTNGENLTAKLEETRLELKGAGDKISQLEFENSKLDNDLNGLTLKNAGFEGHVQVLLSEKNELATCINKVQQENVLLKDQLNEVKTANEYSAVELDKLRTACDKARSENTVLQVALDETGRKNETLRETGEELKLRLAEIHSEYRILKNQLKILQLMNATLRKEKDMLEHEYANSLRLNLSRMEKEEGSVVYSERGKQIAKPLTGKAASETKRDNLTKSSKHGKQKTVARKDVKKLTVENESLKFEILHLRSQNFEVKVELTRLKEELQRQQIDLSNGRESDVAIKSNKPEIVDLYYKEISSYSSRDNNVSTVACIDQSSVCPYDVSSMEEEAGTDIERLLEMINKLKVENVALKIEVNSLRCNLVVNFVEDEKRRNEVRDTTEEIGALKVELTKVREEKESLRVRLDTAGTKLNQLESEKAALKDELYTLRKINSDFKHKVNELRCDYQKLKERSGGFENCIVRAIKKIKKHTTSTEDRNSPASELTCLLKRYISDENVMCSIEQGITMEGT
ncbi:hypothetical protein WH47_01814 [Habropoda laboriosa]|uniref:Uncharacterized protein n=1 Tax=Habropoda laboriosa TaxID=597456 RepID=A0A0L7QTN7_9HYME|nr:hypothetical protein WH47_01814 [Habropoda laboriosa]